MSLFDGGRNKEGRFPLTVLLRFGSACFWVSSRRATGCAMILCERPGIARGPPTIRGAELGGNGSGFCCGVVPVFLTNVFPGEGGCLSLFRLAFLPIDEKNPPVDLLADNGKGIGRDLMEDGGDVTVELFVKLRVIGARDG